MAKKICFTNASGQNWYIDTEIGPMTGPTTATERDYRVIVDFPPYFLSVGWMISVPVTLLASFSLEWIESEEFGGSTLMVGMYSGDMMDPQQDFRDFGDSVLQWTNKSQHVAKWYCQTLDNTAHQFWGELPPGSSFETKAPKNAKDAGWILSGFTGRVLMHPNSPKGVYRFTLDNAQFPKP